MNFIIPITELFTYILFSILVGHVALQFIHKDKKPTTKFPKSALLLSTLGIIVFTFGPVLQVILYFADSVGLGLTTFSVITDFQVGNAWIFIGFVSTLLYMTILLEGSKFLQAIWLLLMILAVGYASHVASLNFWYGFISHSIHFLMVTLWVGILIHVGWFSKDKKNWSSFLKWFTPLAYGILIFIFVSGLILMVNVVELKEYVNAWVLPYGQMLLLKHISIIPILIFAFINSILLNKSKSNSGYDPRTWVKAETILLLITFFFTSVLGNLSPPHDVNFTVKSKGAASWVEWILGREIASPLQTEFLASIQGIVLVVMSILFLVLIIISFIKNVKPIVSILFATCFILAMYFSLMMNINF